ncbi:MAG: rod shape-determining protein MreD [Oscillospiraceae bacterium]|nr:rod shape-determining protein MreD [Oscillospiraceae bacterium]
MKRKQRITKIALHALLILVVYVFQGMVFPYLRLAGLSPLLLPLVSTGFAVQEGRQVGGITGIFAGILCDLSLNEPVGLFTVVLTFTGLAVGELADTVITRRFITYLMFCVGVLVICAIAQVTPLIYRVLIYQVSIPPGELFWTAIWQTVYSLIFSIPIWVFIKSIVKRTVR